MATTILSSQKSTGGSPYAYYTITAEASNRTTFGVTISGTITSHLASSSSSLGTGQSMGLNAFLTLNGVEQSAVNIKSTGTSWSGTSNHNTNYSFTISNLQPTQTSIPISVRISRTGSAENNYSYGASLKSTTCTALTIAQGVGQSVFNSISNPTTNGTFSLSITSYSGYDVLTIKNGGTTIKTINGVANGVAYSFSAGEQSTLVSAIGTNGTSINLTAILETFVSNGGTSLGTTSKAMNVSLPAYTPTITLSSYSDSISTYDTYKNNATDIIKGLSKPTIVVSASDNYNNTYSSASCNGTNGTINGRTITFSALNQANTYSISITDSRGKTGTLSIDGSSYSSTIKTIQWFKGSLPTTIVRPSPTGTTANVTITPNIYDGTNLKTSALLSGNFTLHYTQAGGTEVTKSKSNFTESSGVYSYTITGLDATKVLTWYVDGTDKIGVATNGDSGTLNIGLPVFNAYKDSNGNQTFKVNGTLSVSGAIAKASFIELYTGTPFIDFHYNNSSADYTSRIIEWNSGQLSQISNTKQLTSYYDGSYYWRLDTNASEVKFDKQVVANSFWTSGGVNLFGGLNTNGSDIVLGTSNSSTNDSSDIVFRYGNGQEKVRFWTDNEYYGFIGINFRQYKNDGTLLGSSRLIPNRLATASGMSNDITLSKDNLTKLTLTNIETTNNAGLSLNNGGIYIGAGISKIKVSGQAYFTTFSGSNGLMNLYIHKNSVDANGEVARAVRQGNHNYQSIALSPKLISVSEGNIIYLSAKAQNQNIGLSSGTTTTYLTVEVVQ